MERPECPRKHPPVSEILGFRDVPLLFANFARVVYTPDNFEIDFAQVGPTSGDLASPTVGLQPVALCRIAIPVSFMPRLIRVLQGSLEKFRQQHGSAAEHDLTHEQEGANGD